MRLVRSILKSLDVSDIKDSLLTPRQRQMTEYFAEQDMPLKELARRMDMTEAEARRALEKVMQIAAQWEAYRAAHLDDARTAVLEKGEVEMIVEALENVRQKVYAIYEPELDPDWREQLGFDIKKLEALLDKLRAL